MRTDLLTQLAAHTKAALKLSTKLESSSAPDAHAAKKRSVDRSGDVVQFERHMHEIHCLTVELGLADPQPHRYGEKRISLGFGRETLDPRRTPVVK